MKGRLFWFSVALLLAVPGYITHAEHRRDALNELEINQLRDAAQDGDARLKLYVKFARIRMDALEQVIADPKIVDRAQQTRDRLQDFLDVYDEFDQNVDTFADRKTDLRKVLKIVIEADTEFQSKLRAVRGSSTVKPEISRQYDFLLNSALEAVDNGAQDHRQLLAEQEEFFKHKKKNKADDQAPPRE